MISNGQIEAAEVLRFFANPIFGFALNRVKNREEAEDLAQEIMLQLFKALSSGSNIDNLEAYIWTVARYTWVHWVKKRAHAPKSIELNGVSGILVDTDPVPLDHLLANESYRTLRREISFLSSIHRRIVVMFYYDGLKHSEIARTLGIPVGTVKWHLHDARKELKKGMERVFETGVLSVKPIRFSGMGHSGSPGIRGETNDFLGRTLAQNIVYAAYHKPMSVAEIAEAMDTPTAFLEEEVRYLAEYAYLVESSPGKFRSNTIVWDTTTEQAEAAHRLFQACAAEIAETQFEALMDVRNQVEETGIYYPERDYNFLLWTLLPKTIAEQAWRSQSFSYDFQKVAPIRKDGGQYIAYGHLESTFHLKLSYDLKHYEYCGVMNREQEGSPLYLWQMNTFWSERQDWRYLNFQDVEICHEYRRGELADNEVNREKLSFLLEKEYIRKTPSGYLFNAVWIDSSETLSRLDAAMPDLTKSYAPAIRKLYTEIHTMAMQNQPKNLEPQIAYMMKSDVSGGKLVTYVLKHLVDNNRLKEPLQHQRKTITTWMGPVKS